MEDRPMSEETKTKTEQELWLEKKIQEEKLESQRQNNIKEFLNDPDESKRELKKRIWEGGLKERIEKNPVLAENKELLVETYLIKLEAEHEIAKAREGDAKHKQTNANATETVKPPAANPTETKSGGIFKEDGKLDRSKVTKTTADMAEMIGL
jgi:hypothetical protein